MYESAGRARAAVVASMATLTTTASKRFMSTMPLISRQSTAKASHKSPGGPQGIYSHVCNRYISRYIYIYIYPYIYYVGRQAANGPRAEGGRGEQRETERERKRENEIERAREGERRETERDRERQRNIYTKQICSHVGSSTLLSSRFLEAHCLYMCTYLYLHLSIRTYMHIYIYM